MLCGLPTLTANLQKAGSYSERLFRGEEIDSLEPALLDAARPDIYERLDRDFYDPRLATLTPDEQDLMLASANSPYPPLRSSELGSASAKTPARMRASPITSQAVSSGFQRSRKQSRQPSTQARFLCKQAKSGSNGGGETKIEL